MAPNEMQKKPLQIHQKIMHSTNTLEHTLIILKCMVNEHVFMNLVSLSKISSPHSVVAGHCNLEATRCSTKLHCSLWMIPQVL